MEPGTSFTLEMTPLKRGFSVQESKQLSPLLDVSTQEPFICTNALAEADDQNTIS